MRRVHSLLLLSLFFFPLLAVAGGHQEALVGGWSPIKDLTDPHVKEIAEFAVKEYDKETEKKLTLEKVVKGETQVGTGTYYRLVLAAKDGSSTAAKNCEATVSETEWEDLTLIAFIE